MPAVVQAGKRVVNRIVQCLKPHFLGAGCGRSGEHMEHNTGCWHRRDEMAELHENFEKIFNHGVYFPPPSLPIGYHLPFLELWRPTTKNCHPDTSDRLPASAKQWRHLAVTACRLEIQDLDNQVLKLTHKAQYDLQVTQYQLSKAVHDRDLALAKLADEKASAEVFRHALDKCAHVSVFFCMKWAE